MHKTFLRTAFVLGGLAVALGAFGAHALKDLVSANAVNIFETGVKYQLYHVFALCITAIVYKDYPTKWLKCAGASFIAGIVLFSGSLYVLTYFVAIVKPPFTWVAILTPVGGLMFILGWAFLFFAIQKKR